MSVISPEAPASARMALAEHIAAFMDEPPKSTGDAVALPIFVVDQKEAISLQSLCELAQPNAWRFLLKDHGRPVALGDVTWHGLNFMLSAVFDDPASVRKLEREVRRAGDAAAERGDFELRLFEAPAFHLRAVWLHRRYDALRGNDYFLLLDRRRPSRRATLMTADQFVGVFNAAQAEKLGSPEPEDGSVQSM